MRNTIIDPIQRSNYTESITASNVEKYTPNNDQGGKKGCIKWKQTPKSIRNIYN